MTEPQDAGLSGKIASALLHGLPDAVIYCDRGGAIRFWNAGATRMFGFAEDEALGQSLDIIIPERLRKRHWDGYDRMMETGESRHAADALLAVPATTRSGEAISVQFTVAAVRDDGGAITGIVALLRDVTGQFAEMKRLRAQARAGG
ncbi:MAG: PAS domain-containing protein [Flavobacteriaceae bacterium]